MNIEKYEKLKNRVFIIINILGNFQYNKNQKLQDFIKKELYKKFYKKQYESFRNYPDYYKEDYEIFNHKKFLNNLIESLSIDNINNTHNKIYSIYLQSLKKFGEPISKYNNYIDKFKLDFDNMVKSVRANNKYSSAKIINLFYNPFFYYSKNDELEQIINRINFFIVEKYNLEKTSFENKSSNHTIGIIKFLYDKYHNTDLFSNFEALSNDLHLIFYKI